MTHTHHAIDYVELAADDLDAAKQFYGQVFGWRFNDYGPDYAGIQAPDGDGEVGGIFPGGHPGAGGVLVLIHSDDLDGSEAAIREAGGTIVVGPHDFPGGRRLEFADPSGNRLGVVTYTDG